ncbi:MAG: N-acetylmuramoyl-L-alanine amidase [Bacillus sp. (in: firmicutes)]
MILWLNEESEFGLLNKLERNQQTEQGTANEETKSETASQPAQEPELDEEEAIPEQELDFLVVIDPGHQKEANLEQEPIGPGAAETKYKVTGGTTGVITNKPEYVLNLEASLLLQEQLEERGIQVILTRNTNDVDISNKERAEMANSYHADLFVRVHADGSESAETKGFSVLVPSQNDSYTASIYQESNEAATFVINHVSPTITLNQTGLFYRSDMSGFNWSEVPVILLEIGFMTNPEDDQNLSDPTYLENLMELVGAGIEAYAQTKQ